jgi:hypothetical protein
MFLDRFLGYFNLSFPLKLYKQKDVHNNGWITSGIKKSSQKMKLFNDLKCKVNLPKNALIFIKRYQKNYKQVIYNAKERYNDTLILQAKHPTKAMWKLINKLGDTRDQPSDILPG